jgi:cell wall-associated NlpC family hydrolase
MWQERCTQVVRATLRRPWGEARAGVLNVVDAAGRDDQVPNPTGHASQANPGNLTVNTNFAMPARIAVAGLVAVGLSGGVSAIAAQPTGVVTATQGAQVVRIAATKKGTPYRYGSTGPTSFDCSGYSKWVFARIGKSLPRTAKQQYRATIHISRSSARPGDLVFFGGARTYHMGIYAGGNKMWHAPRSGKTVSLVKIWTSKVTFGRVR